ncbi:hypothetical protein DFJ63DRAFT_315761 [Scheffersomyces coipomensis]|uniref:uncharacterized protein n=1 Tax=Scheffersomyces coipomensis TaxID=1788519 RepID=UPI00315DC555
MSPDHHQIVSPNVKNDVQDKPKLQSEKEPYLDGNVELKKENNESSEDGRSYKNVSINSILNIHGRTIDSNSGAARLPSLESAISSTKPFQSNLQSSPSYSQYYGHSQQGSSNLDVRLSSASYYEPHLQNSQAVSNNYPSNLYHNKHILPEHRPPITSLVNSNSNQATTNNYPHNMVSVPYPQVNSYAQSTGMNVSQSVPAGAPLNVSYHALEHQTHSASDLDPLHENKRGRRFRRRYNQIVRKYSCSFPGCVKSYGSLNHLNTHIVTKKHGHRKSKADFQHSHLLSEEISKGHYIDGNASHLHQQGPQQSHSEYTSGNYWYGFPVQARGTTNQTIPMADHSVIVNSAPPPPPPPVGYMYYSSNYPGQPVQQPQVNQQRIAVGWPQQAGYQPFSQSQQTNYNNTLSEQILPQSNADKNKDKNINTSQHPK